MRAAPWFDQPPANNSRGLCRVGPGVAPYARLTAYFVFAAAVIVSTYRGDAWAMLVAGLLFLFIYFPGWRGKMYRLADKWLSKNDAYNHPD